ncbi:MAG: AIR synthase-related protein [Haloferacaceae archaeon]
MAGKLTPAALERLVFARTGAANDDVLVGPAYGEDAAAVADGDRTLVASTDPISLAADRIGRLAVAVATNDVAASGGLPEYLLPTILLPDEDLDRLDRITADLDDAAERLGVAVVGGHTEVVAGLSRPLLSLACFGFADRFVPTSGAEPGDRVLLTKSAGIEATAVIAADFGDDLDLSDALVERATRRFDQLSVLPEATALAPLATAMHDPTEGGVLGAAVELARASGVAVDLDREALPVAEDTREVCAAAGVDPLRVLGSGALFATVPGDAVDDALDAVADADVPAAVVGRVGAAETPAVRVDGERHAEPVRDEMYRLWD